MADRDIGYVYIMINESMKDTIKIGVSKDTLIRAKQLRTTGVPSPFEVIYSIHVYEPYEIEKLIHTFLASKRIDPRRKFFKQVNVSEVIHLIEDNILPIYSHFNGSAKVGTRMDDH